MRKNFNYFAAIIIGSMLFSCSTDMDTVLEEGVKLKNNPPVNVFEIPPEYFTPDGLVIVRFEEGNKIPVSGKLTKSCD